MQETTYRYSAFARFFIFIIVAPGLVIGAGALGYFQIIEKPEIETNIMWLFIALMAVMVVIAGWAVADILSYRVVINDESVTLYNLRGQRSLYFADIKGYRKVEKKFLKLIPAEQGAKSLEIRDMTERTEEIRSIVASKLPDLDKQEYEAEEKMLMQNEDLGDSELERSENLKKIKRTVLTVNGTCIVVSLIFAFFNNKLGALEDPIFYLSLALMFVPVWLVRQYKGIVRVTKSKNDPRPSMLFGIIGPVLLLCMGAAKIDTDNYMPLVNYMLAIAATLAVLFLFIAHPSGEEGSHKAGAYVILLLVAAAYGFSIPTFINCHYDNSTPKVYDATVLGKEISGGKSKSYYLSLTAWGKHKEGAKESVGSKYYNRKEVGDHVTIYYQEGFLHAPWYYFR